MFPDIAPVTVCVWVKLTYNAQTVLLKNSTRSRPQGRNADYSLKWISAAKCAQQHSYTLGRFSGQVGACPGGSCDRVSMLLIARVQFLMNPRSTSDIIPNVRSRGAAPFKAHAITPLLGLPGPKTGLNCFVGASKFRTFSGSY